MVKVADDACNPVLPACDRQSPRSISGQVGEQLHACPCTMDQISIKTPIPKCRLYKCLLGVYRLEIQSVMLVFSNPLVNHCSSRL